MAILVSDVKLFAIILYATFVNNKYLPFDRDIWNDPFVTGIAGAAAIGLVGAIIAPFILSAIIYALGFGVGGIAAESFGAWFMSLYGGTIARGSLVSILQSIGAAGLGAIGTTITSGLGIALGTLVGAIGGSKLADYFKELDLNDSERPILESLVQIEQSTYQNHQMVVFALMPALLYNDTILRSFFDTFKNSSLFARSKLFRFDFKENNLSLLKSEQENINNTVYNLLISDYDKSRVEYIFRDDYLFGYNVNLRTYQSPNDKITFLSETWRLINGNVVVDIKAIRDKFRWSSIGSYISYRVYVISIVLMLSIVVQIFMSL
jgi:hypothetical protein